MYILKGFITFPSLTDNAIGRVHEFGELSKDSLTYTKETGIYKKHSYPNTVLNSFRSYSSVNGVIEVPDIFVENALRISRFLFEQMEQGRITNVRTQVHQLLMSEFGLDIENLELGNVVTNGIQWMPEWISYTLRGNPSSVKLWYSDQSFSATYDEYEYEFIPPIPTLDDFFRPDAQVSGLLAENSVKRLMERIEKVRAEYPFTLLRTEEYGWVSPNDSGLEVNTNWTIMIYGRAGNNFDLIRQALVEWILANSTYDRDDWLAIFPDIFTPTEFIILPFWHQYAVPNQTVTGGLHSPIISLTNAFELTKRFAKGIGYAEEHLMDNTIVGTTPNHTLGFTATGSQANRCEINNLKQLYPDYIGLSIGSADFARLSSKTQNWMRLFVELLKVAETLTPISIVPMGFTRIIRDNIAYVAKEHDGFYFLVLTKYSAFEYLDIESPYEPEFPEDNLCSIEGRMIREHLVFINNPHGTNKTHIGLPATENTEYLTLVEAVNSVLEANNDLFGVWDHIYYASNPHGVTKVQLGLSQLVDAEFVYLTVLDDQLNIGN